MPCRRFWMACSGEELRERVRLADAAIVAGADDLPRRLHLSAIDGEEVAVEHPVAALAGGVRVRELDVAVVAVAKYELDGAPAQAFLVRRLEMADEVPFLVGACAGRGQAVEDDLGRR